MEAMLKLLDRFRHLRLANDCKQRFVVTHASAAVSEVVGVALLQDIEDTLAHLMAAAQRVDKSALMLEHSLLLRRSALNEALPGPAHGAGAGIGLRAARELAVELGR